MDKIFELEDELKILQLEGVNVDRCKEILKGIMGEVIVKERIDE